MLIRISPLFASIIAFAAVALGQGPTHAPPQSVGIDYPIVVCKMPDNPSIDASYLTPDGSTGSLQVGPGSDLVVVFPDGTEQVLVDASVVTGHPHASCVDPCVSFDGTSVYFSIFEDPRVHNLVHANRQVVPPRPAHIWRATIQSLTPTVSATVTQLTFGTDVAYTDQAHPEYPFHRLYDMSPVELPDGRILFLSSRSNVMDLDNRRPAMRFYRMHADGSNIEPLENFTLDSCQHPIVLMDGRIVWTHTHRAGRRGHNSDHPLMVARPDMSGMTTFAGANSDSLISHFVTQLAPGPQSPLGQGDIVVGVYYPANNFGHGSLIRFPVHNPSGVASVFKGVSDDLIYDLAQWTDQSQPLPNGNTHFQRVGESLVTPWTLKAGALAEDEDSAFLPGTTTYAGKATMPGAAPNGDLLFIWSPGKVNRRPQFAGRPDMKIAFAPGGSTDAMQSNMTVIREAAGYHYMYPRALVPYFDIYGVAKPAILPDTLNDGVHAVLPAGGPFATAGTSSVYNRESRWPAAYADHEGPDPWDPAIAGSGDYRLKMAYKSVGQDTRPFDNSEIFGVQIVADMSHVFSQDGFWMNTGPTYVFRSHNNGSQVWGVLGEAPVRKFDGNNQPVMDPWNNPDTSYEVRVPADTPFHNRLIDSNGMTLTAEQTWHSARPGERKNSCGGCHAHSDSVSPQDFSLSFAGNPANNYSITDMALQTPMLREENGQPVFAPDPAAPNPRIRIVEWFRDIQPIVQAKCLPCHTGPNPDGELDLDAPRAWERLAYIPGSSPTKKHPAYGTTQVTRYVRKHSAAQSLLIWRIFGARLDGRTNAQRPTTDIDYDPASQPAMPPPGSPQLTFDEKRLLALWVDLGCLVDLTVSGPGQQNDPFDDQMKPTLVLSGVEPGWTNPVATTVTVGVYDLHSGVRSDSLDVRIAGSTINLAANQTVTDGAIVTVNLPAMQLGRTHTIEVSVADNAGNVARRSVTTTPLHSPSTAVIGPGSQGFHHQVPQLSFLGTSRLGDEFGVRLQHPLPGALAVTMMSVALENPPQPLAPGVFFYLRNALSLGTGALDAAGIFDTVITLPNRPGYSGARLHFQGAVLDPHGALIAPGARAAFSGGMTATLGW